ncbi:MAG: hypothetical protein LAN62_01150 [Acidobacteriia bacterium]|nr:hypothetical protein [Terriglobia bacterium]
MKFSYDFPEPSVEFEGLRFGFRIYTYENAYGLDREEITVEEKGGALEVRCSQLVWAGGQEKAPGQLTARLRKNGSYIEWSASAEAPQRIKSLATVLRGVPRGKLSNSAGDFIDPKDDEVLLGYPFAAGGLFGPNEAWSMETPLAIIQSGDRDFFFLSCLDDKVRAKRFYFQPGEKTYRVELVFEKEGWLNERRLESPVWRVGKASTIAEAARPHYEHLERAFRLPAWETREDVPAWLRETALAVTLHGMAWTGYIFNDYARMAKILEWVATQIPASRVLAFIAAWDGRYYWNYPLYQPDERMGGEAGFRALIQKGQSLGFKLMPMFGANAAHQRHAIYAHVADAATAQIDGDRFDLNYVDWDNDRHQDGGISYMNLGVDSWREWLTGRIADIIEKYRVDAYFLDIVGGWMDNTKADMHEGTRRLVADLRARDPRVVACGEMSYDALLSVIPLYHVFTQRAYPDGFKKYARAFQHLSHPAPGRGSTGVHEFGFQRFDTATLSLNEFQIPTLNVVDDTFDRYRDLMAAVIRKARERANIR